MNNARIIIGSAGVVALLLNLILPDSAFGQPVSGNQEAHISLTANCGDLYLDAIAGTDILFSTHGEIVHDNRYAFAAKIGPSGNPSQNDFQVARNPIQTTAGNVIIHDHRTEGCVTTSGSGSNEGFILTATATDFSTSTNAPLPEDIIPALGNFYTATTTSYADLSGVNGTGNDKLKYANYTGSIFDIHTPLHIADLVALDSPATFESLSTNNLQNTSPLTLAKNGNGNTSNDYKEGDFTITPVFMIKIPITQATGSYSSTITYTLAPNT